MKTKLVFVNGTILRQRPVGCGRPGDYVEIGAVRGTLQGVWYGGWGPCLKISGLWYDVDHCARSTVRVFETRMSEQQPLMW